MRPGSLFIHVALQTIIPLSPFRGQRSVKSERSARPEDPRS